MYISRYARRSYYLLKSYLPFPLKSHNSKAGHTKKTTFIICIYSFVFQTICVIGEAYTTWYISSAVLFGLAIRVYTPGPTTILVVWGAYPKQDIYPIPGSYNGIVLGLYTYSTTWSRQRDWGRQCDILGHMPGPERTLRCILGRLPWNVVCTMVFPGSAYL